MFGAGDNAGASQFAGGGFMPSPGNQAGPSSAKKNYDPTNQSIRRLTVKQIHHGLENCPSDTLIIDGKEVANVALVGKIVSVREDNVTFNMHLDDGTGRITVKQFLQNNGESDDLERQKRAELREGIYVRAFGHISSTGNERQLQAFSVKPITDHNEVTYHLTQCIFQHLHLTKGGAAAPGGAPKMQQAAPGAAAPPAAGGDAGFAQNGLSPIQNAVLQVFNSPDVAGIDSGISISDVMGRTQNRFNPQQVREAINFLVDEGHLYSTIDDAHWKSCNS